MSGYSSLDPPRQRHAVELARHDDIREHQIDRLARREQLQSGSRRLGAKNTVAELLQQHARDFLDLGVVLDQQHGFAASRRLRIGSRLFAEGTWLRGK